jgi:hypothetical protein
MLVGGLLLERGLGFYESRASGIWLKRALGEVSRGLVEARKDEASEVRTMVVVLKEMVWNEWGCKGIQGRGRC